MPACQPAGEVSGKYVERERERERWGHFPHSKRQEAAGVNSKCGRRKTFQSESNEDDDDGGGAQTHGKAPGGQSGELKGYGDQTRVMKRRRFVVFQDWFH
jgi:hypothetical protein